MEALLLVYLLSAFWPAIFFAVSNCCCSPCARCSSRPTQFQVVISGLTDTAGCSTCATHDGTYILSLNTAIFGECGYRVPVFGGCYASGGYFVWLGFSLNGAQTQVNVSINTFSGAADVQWRDDLGVSPINCSAISGIVVPRSGFASAFFCSDISSTCTITAIP